MGENTVPAHFTAEVLKNFMPASTSCPENKTLHEQTTTLEETFRVIPLRTGSYESLLSVHSVKDSDGKNWHELSIPQRIPRKAMEPTPSAKEDASVSTPVPPRSCSAICPTCWMTRPMPSMPYQASSYRHLPSRWSN